MRYKVSVQFSRSVVSDSLRPHESQHTRPPWPSPTPGVHSNSCPSSRWCHPAISSTRPLLLLPPIPPSIRVFSNESTLHTRWPKYWSFKCACFQQIIATQIYLQPSGSQLMEWDLWHVNHRRKLSTLNKILCQYPRCSGVFCLANLKCIHCFTCTFQRWLFGIMRWVRTLESDNSDSELWHGLAGQTWAGFLTFSVLLSCALEMIIVTWQSCEHSVR